MKKPFKILFLFPVIIVIAILSSLIGMVTVAVTCVALSAILQLIGELFGLLSGSVPWHIITFYRDGEFVFELEAEWQFGHMRGVQPGYFSRTFLDIEKSELQTEQVN